MRAIDTNIIVRLLTDDNADQVARAKRLVEAGEVFVATTVLLETEWVLRSTYALTPRDIVHGLRQIVGVPQIRVEDPERVARALDWAEAGLDFADALHLAAAQDCDAFMSFDRRLQKAAAGVSDITVIEP